MSEGNKFRQSWVQPNTLWNLLCGVRIHGNTFDLPVAIECARDEGLARTFLEMCRARISCELDGVIRKGSIFRESLRDTALIPQSVTKEKEHQIDLAACVNTGSVADYDGVPRPDRRGAWHCSMHAKRDRAERERSPLASNQVLQQHSVVQHFELHAPTAEY